MKKSKIPTRKLVITLIKNKSHIFTIIIALVMGFYSALGGYFLNQESILGIAIGLIIGPLNFLMVYGFFEMPFSEEDEGSQWFEGTLKPSQYESTKTGDSDGE